MKITKNIGMLLLAIYLIIDGLLGFGLNLGPAIFLLYLVALAAGIFIHRQMKLIPSAKPSQDEMLDTNSIHWF